MEKFSDIKYTRADLGAYKKMAKQLIKQIKTAKSADEIYEAFLRSDAEMAPLETSVVIASVRNTMDTTDKFYTDEMAYYDKALPIIMPVSIKINKALLASPFRAELEARIGKQFFRTTEAELKVSDKKIILESIKENQLCTEYSKLAAACSTDFNGEKCNFYGLLKHMQSTDRTVRKQAFEAWAALYEGASDKLDAVFDKLVKLRVKKAKKMGYASFTDMAYIMRDRFDYNADDIKCFREQVVKHIVPLCDKLMRQQQRRLGVDTLRYYDEQLVFPEGNAVPQGDKDELVAAAQQMYRELSPETGEFFDQMVKYEMFDLLTRPGKHLGGYCTALPEYKMPFIFSNFNGTSADVDVLTHEAGHAFAYYQSSRTQPLSNYHHSTSEINEIHSMSMEHFTYPWMDKFFGEATPKYLYAHLASAIGTIPYLCCVDHFQHEVYARPEMTAVQRREVWRTLEKTYMPWRDYDGNEFLEKGGFWMQKQHIFLYPFYYVDYALAQICAFQFYKRMTEDRKQAFTDYIALCRCGGSLGYFETLEKAGLANPFKDGVIEEIASFVEKQLDGQKF